MAHHHTSVKIMRFSLGGYDTWAGEDQQAGDVIHWYLLRDSSFDEIAQGTLPWADFGDTEEMLMLLAKYEVTHILLDINNGPESSTCPGYTAGGDLADGVHTVAAVLSWHKRLA